MKLSQRAYLLPWLEALAICLNVRLRYSQVVCAGVMKRSGGSRFLFRSVSSCRPVIVPSACWNLSSASAVGSSWLFSTGVEFSAGTPAWSDSAITGEVSASALAPGWSAVKKRAVSCRKGLIFGSPALTVSSVGGLFSIVSWM